MSVNVTRPSGLLVPFEAPELSVDAAIRRGWEMDDDDLLMVPKREELPVYLLHSMPSWEWTPARIPWADNYNYRPLGLI